MDDKTISGVREKDLGTKSEGRRDEFFLTVISGNGRDFGKIYKFSEEITIGRDQDNDIVIHDEQVSKIHCRLTPENLDNTYVVKVTDLNSTNGVHLNGERISNSIAHSGSKIEIGDTILRFNINDEIEEKFQAKIFSFATLDHLTGLYNKRFVLEEFENQCKISRRNNRVFSIVMIDIDDLKNLNEKYGHIGADEYIKSFAHHVKENLRSQDIAGRYGGDEFLVILPETTLEGAHKLMVRMKKRIENMTVEFRGLRMRSTFCAGISQFILHARDMVSLVDAADKALFDAKKSGKNEIVNASAMFD